MSASPDSTDLVGAGVLRDLRRRTGWTQEETARRAGLPEEVLTEWESGASQPTLGALIRLVEMCGYELRLRVDERDQDDEVLLARTTEAQRDALAAEERERVERLKAQNLA